MVTLSNFLNKTRMDYQIRAPQNSDEITILKRAISSHQKTASYPKTQAKPNTNDNVIMIGVGASGLYKV
ncbi:hypothetical protein LPTSP4_19300 [Leptospira ryugenii]|uniref:Uncharacterized protein n=2 Tax=Leptospira ryugenii TaxID=1917863 RepID=A0A2P2E0I5_9LEPT|nr:hypothetical protein LPTSP4_19300 [Leptospira ryugenii]